MQSNMKRFLLLLLVLMLVLTSFIGCTKPKVGDVYKDTKGKGTITLTSKTTFKAVNVTLDLGGFACIPITGSGTFSYVGNTIRFSFTKANIAISSADYLTAVVNADGSFTACGRTYKKK